MVREVVVCQLLQRMGLCFGVEYREYTSHAIAEAKFIVRLSIGRLRTFVRRWSMLGWRRLRQSREDFFRNEDGNSGRCWKV